MTHDIHLKSPMDLYSPVILELNSSAPNFGKDEGALHRVKAYNTYCGDKFVIAFNKDNTVEDVSFHGYGCAVSKASAGLMTEVITGKTLPEVAEICRQVIAFLKGENDNALELDERLQAFGVVKKYPGRYDCAALCWGEMLKYSEGISEPT
jgi:nitrogen fixation NifU-like protein